MNYSRKFDKKATAVIALAPLFANYGVGFLLLPELVFIPILLLSIFKKGNNPHCFPKAIIIYVVFSGLSCITGFIYNEFFSFSVFVTTYSRYLFYVLMIVFVANRHFDLKTAYRTGEVISFINSIYLFVQLLMYKAASVILPCYFAFLPLKQDTMYIKNTEYYVHIYGYRPSGLFFEPEQFSLYVVPFILAILFSDSLGIKVKHKYLKLLIFAFATLMSGSGTGCGLLVLSIFLYVFDIVCNRKYKSNTFITISALIIIGIVVFSGMSTTLLTGAERLTHTSELSSFAVRFYRGFKAYAQYPIINKIFGIGYGNYEVYNTAMSIQTVHDIGSSSYVNAAAFILTGTGIIGFAAYIMMYLDLCKHTKGFFRYRSILLVVVTFFTTEPISMTIILIYGFILSGYKREANNNEDIICNTSLAGF